LIGVGVGPGDPELLTLKALRAIESADVIFAPVRRDGEPSLALEIVRDRIDTTRQRVVTLSFPERGEGESWERLCRTILGALDGNQTGVFLTEGDPSLYSTFDHVRRALPAVARDTEISVGVVPGVSSINAAAAAAGLSLADSADRVAIVPAMEHPEALERALRDFQCVVIVKLGPRLGSVLDLLDRLGLLDRAVYVRRCGWPEQEVVYDLRALRQDPPRDYFALIIVRRERA
jgi:precorrin-2/cobalt-factor-2 C20-methyltransferase